MIDLSRAWPFALNRRNWPLYLAGLVLVLAVLVPFDHQLSVLATSQSAQTVAFFNELTGWGKSDWILIPSGVLLLVAAIAAWVIPRRAIKLALIEIIEMLALIFVGVGLPGLVAAISKRLVGRARPEMFDSVGVLQFHPIVNGFAFEGFPSGHSTTAFAAAMVLGFLAPRWFGIGLLYAFGIALSRLVVGAHYPTDVIAGAVLGTMGAYAVRAMFARRRWGFERRPDGLIVPRPSTALFRLTGQRKRAQ